MTLRATAAQGCGVLQLHLVAFKHCILLLHAQVFTHRRQPLLADTVNPACAANQHLSSLAQVFTCL